MTRLSRAVLLVSAMAATAGAQQGAGASIAARVAAAPDGEVRMTYASRGNACGDGKDAVAIGHAFSMSSSFEGYGRWSGMRCVHGPARVAVVVRGHEIAGLHAHVGGGWPAGSTASLDLGTVPAADAAAYFLSLAKRIGSSSRRNPMLAAALADSANVAPDFLRLARDVSLGRDSRRRAVHWVGVVGDASMVAPLTELANAGGGDATNADDPGPGDGLPSAAVGALAMLDDGAGVDALMGLARRGSVSVRKAAVFWLGRSDEPRGRTLVRTIVEDGRESEAVRGAAIFALGQGENQTESDAAFLRAVFDRMPSERLKDRILMSVSQSDADDGTRWLLDRARDDRQPMEVRRKAVFWAGQGHARVADLTALYASAREPPLREQVIFVLSQRHEEAATDELMDIARGDGDMAMRRKALFWLAQKNDPRVTKLIAELVAR